MGNFAISALSVVKPSQYSARAAAAKLDVDIALAGAEVARLAATEQSINLMLAKVTSGFDNAVGILSRM